MAKLPGCWISRGSSQNAARGQLGRLFADFQDKIISGPWALQGHWEVHQIDGETCRSVIHRDHSARIADPYPMLERHHRHDSGPAGRGLPCSPGGTGGCRLGCWSREPPETTVRSGTWNQGGRDPWNELAILIIFDICFAHWTESIGLVCFRWFPFGSKIGKGTESHLVP